MSLVYANAPAEAMRPVGYPLNSWEAIIHAINYRRTFRGRMVNEMVRIRDIYNGDWFIPMPDVKGEPDSKPAIPALVNMAIDDPAQRAASTLPQIFVPAIDPSKGEGKKSRRYADIRKRALHSNWHFSGMREVLLPKAFRHYRAYGSWAFIVRPDHASKRARIETRDPMNTYPDLAVNDVTQQPQNIGFMSFRSRAWLVQQFSRTTPGLVGALANSNRDDSDIFEMVEWIDEKDYVVGVIGPRYAQQESTAYPSWPVGGFQLLRWPNRAGMCPASVPYRVTLDRVMGAVNLIVPIVNKMAKLDLLDYFASEKAVFPDLVVMGKDGEPRLVGGAWKDGRTGEANIIENGAAQYLNTTPGPQTQQRIDQLERSARQTSGNPAMFGGEATGNIRSGQTVSQLGSYSVDPDLQEMQLLMQRSLQVVNEAIYATEAGYWPAKKYTVFSGLATDMGQLIYTPSVHFETYDNVVRYPLPGTDVSGQTVAVGQLVGTGLMSKNSGRRIHPLIEDPDAEEAQVNIEKLEDAMMASILTQAQAPPEQGGTQPIDLATVLREVRTGALIEDAIFAAQSEAQTRQATAAPPPGPGQITSPEAQPGLSAPGGGAEMPQMAAPPPPVFGGPPAIGPASPSMSDLKDVFRALSSTAASKVKPQ